jgi:hypothetical protein
MPKGGRRPGAGNPNWKPGKPQDGHGKPLGGRPPGRKNSIRSYHTVKKAYESGEPVPLDVMLYCMNYFFKKSKREETEEAAETALKESGTWAMAAARFMHPTLQAIDARTTTESKDTLSALLREIDGSTTGITNGESGEPELAAQQLIHVRH